MKIRYKEYKATIFYNLKDFLEYLQNEKHITESESNMLSFKFKKFIGEEMSVNNFIFLYFGKDELYFSQFYLWRSISYLSQTKRHRIIETKIYENMDFPMDGLSENIFEPC